MTDALEASTAAPREVRKTVTVVFTDVTGSTAMGEHLDPESLPMAKGSLARVRAHQGRVDEAVLLVQEAVAELEGTDFLTDHADVLTDAADAFLVAGRAKDAADALALAMSLYEQKGDTVTPPRIRAMLDGIRPT